MNLIQKISENIKIGLIKINALPLDKIAHMSENLQYAAILKNPAYIKQVDKPSEKIQLAAITQNPKLITKIANPTEAVQEEFMKNNPNSFHAIQNPSEKTLLSAVAYNAENIRYITFPSEEVQKVALQHAMTYDALIEIVRKPNITDDVLKNIIQRNPSLIEEITSPKDHIQMLAVLSSKTQEELMYVVHSISHPSKELQNYILDTETQELYNSLQNKNDSIQIRAINKYDDPYIDDQTSPIVQEAAILKNPANIRFLYNPNEKLQLLAINSPAQPWNKPIFCDDHEIPVGFQKCLISNPGEYIKFIKNPTELVQRKALEQDLSNIHHIKLVTESNARYALETAGFPKESIDKLYSLPAAAKSFIRDCSINCENKEELIKQLLQDYGKKETKNLTRKQQQTHPF